MRVRDLVLAVLLVTSGLAGCIGDEETDAADAVPANATNATAPLELAAPEVRNRTLHVDIDMPVVTVGFSEAAVAELGDRLDNETVRHWGFRGVPVVDPVHRAEDLADGSPPETDRTEGDPLFQPTPIAATARYHVEPVGQAMEANFSASMAQMASPGNANQLESLLEDGLAERDAAVDPNRPLLVLLDTRGFEDVPEEWNYTFPVSDETVGQDGSNQTVAVFGEREPLLVADLASLGLDPAQDGPAIEALVRNATHYRLLQGPNHETPYSTCHAVTVITAYRPSTPGDPVPEGFVHEERIRAAFANLTRQPVHVNTKQLVLPEDDPGLDAAFRPSVGPIAVPTSPYHPVREWIAAHWEDYWVEREGCAAYVSVVLFTDQPHAGQALGSFCTSNGIGTYDEDTRYRIAVSRVSNFNCGFGSMNRTSTYLHLHETGHLFGLGHPHEVLTRSPVRPQTLTGGSPSQVNGAFQTVWSTMSYATGFHVQDFGSVDRANFERNQAAYALVAAHDRGLDGEPEYERALEHVAAYEWADASNVLEPVAVDSDDGAAYADMPEVAS